MLPEIALARRERRFSDPQRILLFLGDVAKSAKVLPPIVYHFWIGARRASVLFFIIFFVFHIASLIELQNSQQTYTCSKDQPPSHLVVLSHGWTGTPSNMRILAKEISNSFSESNECALIHAIHSNWGWIRSLMTTSDGIDVGAQRLAQEIVAVKNANPSLDKISVLGHSLGGLYIRYAAGLLLHVNGNGDSLEEPQVSERTKKNLLAGMEPINFISFSTPHTGIHKGLWSVGDIAAAAAFGSWRPKMNNILLAEQAFRDSVAQGDTPTLMQSVVISVLRWWRHVRFGRTFFQMALSDNEYVDYVNSEIEPPILKDHVTIKHWHKKPSAKLMRRRLNFPSLEYLAAPYDENSDVDYNSMIRQNIIRQPTKSKQVNHQTNRSKFNPNLSKQPQFNLVHNQKPILELMTQSSSRFMQALGAFEQRTFYSSVSGDFFVLCCSALASHVCPTFDAVSHANHTIAIPTSGSRLYFHAAGGPHDGFAFNSFFVTDGFPPHIDPEFKCGGHSSYQHHHLDSSGNHDDYFMRHWFESDTHLNFDASNDRKSEITELPSSKSNPVDANHYPQISSPGHAAYTNQSSVDPSRCWQENYFSDIIFSSSDRQYNMLDDLSSNNVNIKNKMDTPVIYQPIPSFVQLKPNHPLLTPTTSYHLLLLSVLSDATLGIIRGRELIGETAYNVGSLQWHMAANLSRIPGGINRAAIEWNGIWQRFFSHGFTVHGFRIWARFLVGQLPVVPRHAARILFGKGAVNQNAVVEELKKEFGDNAESSASLYKKFDNKEYDYNGNNDNTKYHYSNMN